MISAQRSRFLPFLVLLLVAGTALIVPPPAAARLHDPMRPARVPAQHASASGIDAQAALPQLNAILIGATSRVAIFADKRVHEGESIGRFRVTRIHPGRVELLDGKSRLERRLFPAITAFEDK